MELTYAWGEDGFIADLDAQPVRTFEEKRGTNSSTLHEYRTCANGGPFEASVSYDFKYPREARDVIMPGCIATYQITYTGGVESSEIRFSLKDFDLAHRHRDAVDAQILKALETPVAKSEMKL